MTLFSVKAALCYRIEVFIFNGQCKNNIVKYHIIRLHYFRILLVRIKIQLNFDLPINIRFIIINE